MELERAQQQLAEIHRHIARTEIYRGYRAPFAAASGGIAFLGAWLQPAAHVQGPFRVFVLYWSALAVVNVTLIALSLSMDLLRGSTFDRRKTWNAIGQFFPCLGAGFLLTWTVYSRSPELIPYLPGLWSILFSLGVFALSASAGRGGFAQSGKMKVIQASAMGMCFGVRKALQRVRALDPGGDTVLYGELVHSPEVNQRLIVQGWNILDEANRSPQVRESRAVITAHGVSDRELRTLIDSGKRIVDTTCPLVRLAQLTDMICLPTKARENAVVALCRTGIDALVVVGGRNSNNSAQLAALAESLGTRAFCFESAADLQPEELSGMGTVGLTAGTSALDETVDAVEGALEVLGTDRIMGKAS